MAGLCYQVTHASADGILLGAKINPKYSRIISFDTGIYQQLLNSDISGILLSDNFDVINKGAVAEMFVGCELKKTPHIIPTMNFIVGCVRKKMPMRR